MKKVRRSIPVILLFSYIINPFFTNRGHTVQKIIYYLLLGIIIILNAGKLSKLLRMGRRIQNSFVLFAMWIFIIAAVPIINMTFDFTYWLDIKAMLGRMMALLAVVAILQKRSSGDLFRDLLDVFIYTEVVYCMATVVIIMFPLYRNWIVGNVYMNVEAGSLSSNYISSMLSGSYTFTRIGYDGLAVYASGIEVSFSFLCSLYMLYKNKEKNKYLTTSFILFFGSAFYARTSILVNCMALAIYFLILGKRWTGHISWRVLRILLVLLVVAIAVGGRLPREARQWIVGRDGTADLNGGLLQGLFFSVSLYTLLFGEGYKTALAGGMYKHTDSGFMSGIIYYGLIGTFAIYSALIFLMLEIRKRGAATEKAFSYCLIVWFVMFDLKGGAIPFAFPLFLMLCILYCYADNEKGISVLVAVPKNSVTGGVKD